MFSQWFIQKKNDKKVGFEDVIYAIQNPNLCFLINVLPSNEQGCLIIGTMPYENEEREINELLKNNKHDCIIIIRFGGCIFYERLNRRSRWDTKSTNIERQIYVRIR